MSATATRTHYDVLGLARNADSSDVRRAWKVHVQVWHPDRFDGEMRVEAEQQTARINEAYTTLRDASRRAAYDCRLAADELSARPERAATRRPTFAARTATPAPAPHMAAPVATAPPQTLGAQIAELGSEALESARRHPRLVIGTVSVLAALVIASLVYGAVAGPTLPAGSTSSTASVVTDPRAGSSSDSGPAIGDLAAEMRAEADASQRQLDELLQQDAVRPADSAPRAGEAAAPETQLPAAPATTGPEVHEVTKPDGSTVLRVMPSTSK